MFGCQAERLRQLKHRVLVGEFRRSVNLLGLITGSLGKAALDVIIISSAEFSEVYEPFVAGRRAFDHAAGAQPDLVRAMLAASKWVPQHAGMLDAMMHDFERAIGPWQAEWTVPESFVLNAGAAPGEVRAG